MNRETQIIDLEYQNSGNRSQNSEVISDDDLMKTEVYFYKADDPSLQISGMANVGDDSLTCPFPAGSELCTDWVLHTKNKSYARAIIGPYLATGWRRNTYRPCPFPASELNPVTMKTKCGEWDAQAAIQRERNNRYRLKAGDELLIVAINRASGHTGVMKVATPTSEDGMIDISGDMDLYPPEVKVDVTRQFKIRFGVGIL